MIGQEGFYLVMAVVMALVTAGFAVGVARKPEEKRRYYLPIVVLPAISTVSFGLMSQGVLIYHSFEPTFPAARMLGYMLIFSIMGGYIGLVAGLDQRGMATLAGSLFLVIVGSTLNWAPAPLSSVGPLLLLSMLGTLAYLVLGPYNRRARDLPGEQRLLFYKLRNLLLLIWLFYIIATVLAQSRSGLLDTFTTIFTATYLDLVLMATLGFIILGSDDAIEQIASGASRDSPGEPPGQSEETLTDLAD